ncbi:general stress protein [Kocuria massiliensis]|uniref:general stress protein n=1 Tax=Kocuria massiliensis TaxID=1926282 RepID=UPI0022B95BA8|nr:general stress protein [Kocuria massiliensis]
MANSGKSRLAALRSEHLPSSVTVGKFSKYQDAQGAVDLLAERGFPVQNLAIVGTDLRQVEHVVGTLSYARVAASGALQGLFYGVFLGFLLMLFGHENPMAAFLTSVPLGVAFWMILSIVSFSRRGGHRSFTAVGQLVAGSYDLVCAPQEAGEARRLLGGSSQRSPLRPAAPEQPYFPNHGADLHGAQGNQHPQAPAPRPPHSDGSANGPGQGQHAPAPTGREPWGQPGAPQGPQGENPPAGPDGAEPQQARDFKDLPDGRPRFGIRDENPRGNPSPDGQTRPAEGTDEPTAR